MRAFLLAAGKGTRLRPLTDSIPKCLVPIRGRPLMDIWLEHLVSAGVDHVLINIHHHAARVLQFLETVDYPITIHPFLEPDLLGSAMTIHANSSFIRSVSEFFIVYADNLTTFNLNHLMTYHRSHSDMFTMGLIHADQPESKGIVTMDEKQVIRSFEEKPEDPRSDLANAALYVSTPELVNYIDPSRDRDMGYHVLPRLVGKMRGYIINEYFRDIGTLEDLNKAQNEWPHSY